MIYYNNIILCYRRRSDNEVQQLRLLTPASGVRRTVLEPADLQQRSVRRRLPQLRTFRDRRRQRVRSAVQTPPEREAAQRAKQWRHHRQQQLVDELAEQVGPERQQQPEQQPVEQRLVRELQERGDLRVGERGQVFGQQVRAADET